MSKFYFILISVIFIALNGCKKSENAVKNTFHKNFIIADGTNINEYTTLLFEKLNTESGYILLQKNSQLDRVDSVRIIKLDKEMKAVWMKLIEMNNSADIMFLSKCLLLPNDEIIFYGTLLPDFSGGVFDRSFISKIDKSGNIQIAKTFAGNQNPASGSIISLHAQDMVLDYPYLYFVASSFGSPYSLTGGYILSKFSLNDNSIISKFVNAVAPYTFDNLILFKEDNGIGVAGNIGNLFIHHFSENLTFNYGNEYNVELNNNNYKLNTLFKKNTSGYSMQATWLYNSLASIQLNDSFLVTAVTGTNFDGVIQMKHINNEFHLTQQRTREAYYYILDDNLKIISYNKLLASSNSFGWTSRFIENRNENKIEFIIDNVGPEGGSGFQYMQTDLNGTPCFNYTATGTITYYNNSFQRRSNLSSIPYVDYDYIVSNYNFIRRNKNTTQSSIVEVCSK